MSEPFEIDIAAAELRADSRDIPAFVTALGAWFEESVPQLVEVQRKRAGLLDSRKQVVRITCQVGDETYTLVREGAGTTARRAKRVRGITLKNETLSLSEWLRQLTAALSQQAQLAAASYNALRELLA